MHLILYTNKKLDQKFIDKFCSEADLDDLFRFSQGDHLKLKENFEELAFHSDYEKILEAMKKLFSGNPMDDILNDHHCYLKELLHLYGGKVSLRVPKKDKKNEEILKLHKELKQQGKDKITIDECKMLDFWKLNGVETLNEFYSKLVFSFPQPNGEQLKEDMIREGRLWMRDG